MTVGQLRNWLDTSFARACAHYEVDPDQVEIRMDEHEVCSVSIQLSDGPLVMLLQAMPGGHVA
jgi:hypothetical protein